jgi:MFS family permease
MGRQFGWLWAAFAVSTFGTWLAFDAFPLIAILVLHAGPAQVSLLAATGLAVGALIAIPLGPWVEFRRKRPVMIAMDLVRCLALLSVPLAYALGALTFAGLLVVAVIVAAADIAFRAASGACLKALVGREQLLAANARFESTTWTATLLGPPLGGLAIGLFGPVVTVLANAVSFVLSALGIRAIGGTEPSPPGAEHPALSHPPAAVPAPSHSLAAARGRAGAKRPAPAPPAAAVRGRAGAERPAAGPPPAAVRGRADVLAGWRHILASPALRPLFFNTVLVNGLILATAPVIAVLMLGELGFAPWQYALAFGAPCAGGLLGARLSPWVVERLGRARVLRVFGTLRACWSLGLAFIVPGAAGLALVIAVQFGLVLSVGIFNPVYVTQRLEQTPNDRVARTLAAWSVSNNAAVAVLTGLWGVLASVTSPRIAIAVAGVALLATPVLLLRQPRNTAFACSTSPLGTAEV